MRSDPKLVALVKSKTPLAALASANPALRGYDSGRYIYELVDALFDTWAAHGGDQGTSGSDPIGILIPAGSRVLLKPNWVYHENRGGGPLGCLVTDTELIRAVLAYVLRADPARVIIADSPLQSCDFSVLRARLRLDDLVSWAASCGHRVEIRDLRLRTLDSGVWRMRQRSNGRDPARDYVLFDLGSLSFLEEVSADSRRFRVTKYDPVLMESAHRKGRHCYLIAREVLESDVIVNLPKLKTHCKAGMTGALKNVVGINGEKGYLPHHRKGGSSDGGDCYPGRPLWKRAVEELLDYGNQLHAVGGGLARLGCSALIKAAARLGSDANLEGAWYGNDTVWRTVLDLNRILLYGNLDGSLSPAPVRRILHITDAVLAGQGEGPLKPIPAPMGILTAALDGAAADWVHAQLMGMNPRDIPLIAHAFDSGPYPVTIVAPSEVKVITPDAVVEPTEAAALFGYSVKMPPGWEKEARGISLNY